MKIKDLTKGEAVSLLELIHETTLCEEDAQIKELINKLNNLVHFEMVGGVLSRDKTSKNLQQMIHINYGYPDDFVNEYAFSGYSVLDPVVKDVYGTYGVSYWKDAMEKHGIHNKSFCLCHDFSLKYSIKGQGYSCGMRNTKGNEKGAILFSGLPRKERHGTILTLIIPHLHEAMSRTLGKVKSNLSPLSTREKEILQWLMNGKNTWDISTILSISERTVKFHIDNIMKKLDAVNRTHAVAIALNEGLIEIG